MSCLRLAVALNTARPLPLSNQSLRILSKRNQEIIFARRQFSKAVEETARKATKSNGTFKLALLGASIGAVAGSSYTFYTNFTDKNAHKEHERTPPKVIEALPAGVRITKRFINPKDTSGLDIVLFQFQTCPFCCKVRAYLDYMGVSYSVVEVDAVLRQDIRWSSVKKVPMVLIRQRNGQYVQMTDSSAIISLVATTLNDKRADVGELAQFYPQISFFDDDGKKRQDIMNKYFMMYQDHTPKNMTKELEENERKWRTWADSHLVHLISPNCYQTLNESFETFEWFSKAGEWDVYFPKWERDLMVYCGATAMWAIAKMLKRRHDLSDDVRSHIYDALDKWSVELKKRNTKFMAGKQPGLSDLSVFGVLSSMEGCQTFKDCLQNTNIGKWFYDVKELVEQNRGQLHRERIVGVAPTA
ncbi:prostaglandin E synthase 2 [Drosophila sulfurigaster albostrigata]|uniref:Prostaglandin E synthase 2 n=1 Tax=Drosophila albomicans TaxID=7291 RepID=A0A6P8WLL9_DROAB|nr:prostaglandin E synthase 2 [Drosophila albomicans]XP_060658826.1 LOW QUALITY PROTEIN: prostaglandin E synthase 2 [Drosophila nasuta]XP_062132125.1 prostaglandin E synthase 2 [Drosophila sulfurigaster albostrigata]